MGVILGELRFQVAALVGALRLGDRGEAGRLGEEMRRHQDEALDPFVVVLAGVDRRDRGAVAVADENAALETDRAEDDGRLKRASRVM